MMGRREGEDWDRGGQEVEREGTGIARIGAQNGRHREDGDSDGEGQSRKEEGQIE